MNETAANPTLMQSAFEAYFEAAKDFNQPIPGEPTTLCDYVSVEV